MSTVGAFNKKNPTIKRILKEAAEIASSPSPDYHAEPLESDLFEWHFTLRGPPAPSHYAHGIYHGRISLPPSYPLRPPSFKFTTPTGRFETNREICLSISGHHEETWQPAWGIRTALVAIRSFMDTDAKGQVGGLDSESSVKERLARESTSWKCASCGKTNEEIMREKDRQIEATGGSEGKAKEEVPEELKLAYREDLARQDNKEAQPPSDSPSQPEGPSEAETLRQRVPHTTQTASQAPLPQQRAPAVAPPAATQLAGARPNTDTTAWLDKAIYAVAIALVLMILRQLG